MFDDYQKVLGSKPATTAEIYDQEDRTFRLLLDLFFIDSTKLSWRLKGCIGQNVFCNLHVILCQTVRQAYSSHVIDWYTLI